MRLRQVIVVGPSDFCFIDQTTRNVANAHIRDVGMMLIVESMKRRLLFVLPANDQVVAAEYGNG